MLEAPFEVREPTEDTPVVVEVPHAGLWLDAESANWTIAPARSIARDADLYVDELFADAVSFGATYLAARLSRYIVDLNRAESDYDSAAVVSGPPGDRPRGVIWRVSSDGLPVLRDSISAAEYERRMARFYRPYHRTLASLIEERQRRFGFAVVLCAHSMPTPRRRGRPTGRLADIVPGTRGRTSAGRMWIDAVEDVATGLGLEVEHDVPYRGGFTTSFYGQPSHGVHVVQVEIARRLYMNEDTLAPSAEGFTRARTFAQLLVQRLVDLALAKASEQTEGRAEPLPARPDGGVS